MLAVGTTPSMTSHIEEIAGFVESADSLLINVGTMDEDTKQAIAIAIKTLGPHKRFVLDPVFVDRSPPRLRYARTLLQAKPAIIRCNRSEAAALQIPSPETDQSVLALSGATDHVLDGAGHIRIAHGHSYGALVTGAGCALGALMSALLAVEQDAALAAATAFAAYGIAQEIAAQDAEGPGSFAMHLLDTLHHLSAERLDFDLKKMEQE